MPSQSSQKPGLPPAALIIVLLALLGIGVPLVKTSPPPSATAPAAPRLAVEAATIVEHSALDLIEEFLDNDVDQLDRSAPWSTQAQPWPPPNGGWADDPRHNDDVRFLIATLPDPAYASLRYEFDGYLDGIQNALAADGYVLDRFDLPWLPSLAEQRVADDHKGDNTASALNHRPGVMLFRRSVAGSDRVPASDRLLVVFIVGETPTSGVDMTAMRNALDQYSWLDGWNSASAPPPRPVLELTRRNPRAVTIIGPSFSGSADSMQGVLRTWLHSFGSGHAPKLRIFSGTATAIEQWPSELGDFRTMQVLDRDTEAAFVRFFRNHLHERRIAILAENTSYGRSLQASPGKSGRRFNQAGVLWFDFPLHISDVRTAFSNSAGATTATPANVPLFSRRDVPLTEENSGSAADVVPNFSRRSAAYDELVLANLLSILHREHIRYVGIFSSDIEDALFLVSEIRENCPDTTPFLTSTNLLYLHSAFNRDLAGTLLFSTYPLFSMNQVWTSPFDGNRRRVQFTSGESEGVYNAVLAALEHPELMLDYAAPFTVDTDRPPLWLSLVGRDNLWPLRYWPVDASLPVVYHRPLSPIAAGNLPINFRPSLYPRSFEIAFMLVSLLCLIPNLILLMRFPIRVNWLSGFRRLVDFLSVHEPNWLAMILSDAVHRERRLERRLSLLSFNLVLLTTYIVAVAAWLLPLRSVMGFSRRIVVFGGIWSWGRFALLVSIGLCMIAVGCVVLLGTAALIVHAWRAFKEPGATASATIWITAAASIVGAALAVGFAVSIWITHPALALLYFVRASNFGSGVSPLLPLLFLGLAALSLSLCELLRLNLLEHCVITAPFLGFTAEGSFKGADHHEQRTVSLLRCPAERLPNSRLWFAIVLVAFFYFGFSGLKPIPLDGRFFGLFFAMVVIFVYIAYLLQFARFVSVWIELRRLLRRLYFHPTRRAYEELRMASVPPSLAERQRIRMFEPPASMIALEFCLERVRDLIRFSIPDAPPADPSVAAGENSRIALAAETLSGRVARGRDLIAACLADAERSLAAVLECQAAGQWRDAIGLRAGLQTTMARLAKEIATIFEPQWRVLGQPRLVAHDVRDGADGGAPLLVAGELFIASRVVDFLRQIFPQLLSLVVFATSGLLAMMLAASTYPFPQHDTIAWLSWTMLLIVVAVMFVVFVQINRDRVISMLSGTTPGELNWNSTFIWQVLIFGVIPILTLLGAQFPHSMQRLLSWVGTVFTGVH